MPTYEYLCGSCGERFDYFQKMTDEPLKRCICCRRGKVKRQLGTGAGIIFKGSGFYCTDYRSDSYSKAAKKDVSAPSGDAAAAAKPDPPKPATATATKDKPPAKNASKGD
jgi:putative FmdB family regulatory protein